MQEENAYCISLTIFDFYTVFLFKVYMAISNIVKTGIKIQTYCS